MIQCAQCEVAQRESGWLLPTVVGGSNPSFAAGPRHRGEAAVVVQRNGGAPPRCRRVLDARGRTRDPDAPRAAHPVETQEGRCEHARGHLAGRGGVAGARLGDHGPDGMDARRFASARSPWDSAPSRRRNPSQEEPLAGGGDGDPDGLIRRPILVRLEVLRVCRCCSGWPSPCLVIRSPRVRPSPPAPTHRRSLHRSVRSAAQAGVPSELRCGFEFRPTGVKPGVAQGRSIGLVSSSDRACR